MALIIGHYVSKFHLSGFTDLGTEEDKLYVLDKKLAKVWDSIPKLSARKKGMYALDEQVPGDRDVFEKAFGSALEPHFARVVRQIVQSKALPEGEEDFDWLLNFVAFTWVRGPRFRADLDEKCNQIVKTVLPEMTLTATETEALRSRLEATGNPLGEVPPEAASRIARSYLSTRECRVEATQAMFIKCIGECAGEALRCLSLRRWGIWVVPEGGPELICSDDPMFVSPSLILPGITYEVGLTSPNTVFGVPLDKYVLLVGMFERSPGSRTMSVLEVAKANFHIAMCAQQLYSPKPDFVWLDTNGAVRNRADYLARL